MPADRRLLAHLAALQEVERRALARVDGPAAAEALLDSYLGEVEALETRSIRFLEATRGRAGAPALEAVFEAHLEESLAQRQRLDERLAARGAASASGRDTSLRAGGVDIVAFFAAQPEPASRLAEFAFDFEQLEVDGYALLARVARRAGDAETVALAERAEREERIAAAAVAGAWDAALATLGEIEITVASPTPTIVT